MMLECSAPQLQPNGSYQIVFYNLSNNPIELLQAQKLFKEALGVYAKSRDLFVHNLSQNITFYSDKSGVRMLTPPKSEDTDLDF